MKDAALLLVAAEADAKARGKGWVTIDTLRQLLAQLPEHVVAAPVPAEPLPSVPDTIHGLDVQGWFDATIRYRMMLRIIAYTEGGAAFGLDWAKAQARYGLGDVPPGLRVFVMPGAETLQHIVDPETVQIARRRQPMQAPLAVLRPGEEVTLQVVRPGGEAG